jgi:hypothetical protein
LWSGVLLNMPLELVWKGSGSGFSGGAKSILENVWQNGFTLFSKNGLKRSNIQYALSYLLFFLPFFSFLFSLLPSSLLLIRFLLPCASSSHRLVPPVPPPPTASGLRPRLLLLHRLVPPTPPRTHQPLPASPHATGGGLRLRLLLPARWPRPTPSCLRRWLPPAPRCPLRGQGGPTAAWSLAEPRFLALPPLLGFRERVFGGSSDRAASPHPVWQGFPWSQSWSQF